MDKKRVFFILILVFALAFVYQIFAPDFPELSGEAARAARSLELTARFDDSSPSEDVKIQTQQFLQSPAQEDILSRGIVHPSPINEKEEHPPFAKGSLLVKFKPGFAPQSVSTKVPTEFRFTQSRRLFQERHQTSPLLRDVYELTISETVDPRLAAIEYAKNIEVEYAEPNFIAHTTAIRQPQQPALAHVPNDLLYPQQWHLPQVSDVQAWSITQGNPITVIAVIDTGIFWSHPDLTQNIWTNTGEIPNNGIDDDSNGYVDDVRGWDFVETTLPCWTGEDCASEDNDPNDFYGHGTHVAGIAGAVTDNGVGVAGICRKCRIMNVRAGFAYNVGAPYPYGVLENDDIVEAITYAADNGARIISMSFGSEENSITMQNVISYAYSQGAILVAAAGNIGNDYPFYPAVYPNVLSVAATDQNDNKAAFSNYGPWIDTAAPGTNILSTVIPGIMWGCIDTLGGYGYCSGTSMAAPLVSGIIGLALSKNPTLTQDQIFTLVHSAYDPILGNYFIGMGRIDAFEAVLPITVSLSLLDYSLDQTYVSTGNMLAISGTAGGQNFLKYRIDYGGPEIYPTVWTPIQSDTFTPVSNGLLATWNPSSLNIAGTYTIRLQVTDTNQKIWEDRKMVRIDTTLLSGWPKQISGVSSSISHPATRDVNNDGRDEIFFGASSNTFAGFYAVDSNGLSIPGWPVITNLILWSPDISPAVANIDGDASFEAVYGKGIRSSLSTKYFAYEHTGSTQPGWPITIGVNGTELYQASPAIAKIVGNSNRQIVVVTQDSNGPTGSENKIYVYGQNGQIVSGWPKQVNGLPYNTPTVGDIDANGDLEIVVSTYNSNSSNLYVFNHDGTNFPGWPIVLSNPIILSSPVLADIDQNDAGKLEIIQSLLLDQKVYAFNHDGTIVPGFPFNLPSSSSLPYQPAIGDIDDNNDLEIVFSAGNKVYALNHDGTVFPGWPYDAFGADIASPPIIIDLDGDGVKEILVVSYHNKELLGLNSDGTPITNFPKPLLSPSVTAPAAGDFDGDNLIDIFLLDHFGHMYRWEFGPKTSTSFQWPMFHHDAQHTGRY